MAEDILEFKQTVEEFAPIWNRMDIRTFMLNIDGEWVNVQTQIIFGLKPGEPGREVLFEMDDAVMMLWESREFSIDWVTALLKELTSGHMPHLEIHDHEVPLFLDGPGNMRHGQLRKGPEYGKRRERLRIRGNELIEDHINDERLTAWSDRLIHLTPPYKDWRDLTTTIFGEEVSVYQQPELILLARNPLQMADVKLQADTVEVTVGAPAAVDREDLKTVAILESETGEARFPRETQTLAAAKRVDDDGEVVEYREEFQAGEEVIGGRIWLFYDHKLKGDWVEVDRTGVLGDATVSSPRSVVYEAFERASFLTEWLYEKPTGGIQQLNRFEFAVMTLFHLAGLPAMLVDDPYDGNGVDIIVTDSRESLMFACECSTGKVAVAGNKFDKLDSKVKELERELDDTVDIYPILFSSRSVVADGDETRSQETGIPVVHKDEIKELEQFARAGLTTEFINHLTRRRP